MIKNRKSMLEARIARLEKMLKNEGRRGFEATADVAAARAAAEKLARQFEQMVGVKLRFNNSADIVESPMYGWGDVEDLADDPDAKFTFSFDVVGVPGLGINIRPTDKTVCAWASLTDDMDCEGAIDPKTGMCEWEDDSDNCFFPMSAWRNFDVSMIHGEDDYYDESCKRSSKSDIVDRIARLENLISRKSH